MASPTQWTWVWVNSRSCWWTGRPGMLQFMWLQRVGHNWVTELNAQRKKIKLTTEWMFSWISNKGGFPHSSVGKDLPTIQETWVGFDSWVGKIHCRRDRLPTLVFLGFPCGSAGKESICNVGDLGSIHELGKSPGEGKGYPLQYSGLENSMDCIVHGAPKRQTQLSNLYFHISQKLVKVLCWDMFN